jgi:bifunctional DNA-binding transcriptional regulator/antitoxin component of YhaV-PrlF toxin-antitoxin module
MESHFVVQVDEKGRVVIPRKAREEAGMTYGASVVARPEGQGRLVLETREAIRERLHAQARLAVGRREIGAVDKLIADRRADIALEKGKGIASRRARKQT